MTPEKLLYELHNPDKTNGEKLELIAQFKRDIFIERDSIWMDSIAHCDILTNDNIAEIKRAVSWHDKPLQNQNKL